MPRTARIAVVGAAHLVYQHSAGKKALFRKDKDYQSYLEFLYDRAVQYKTDVLAYSLMRDRVYLVVVPNGEDSLAKAVGRTHFDYAQYVSQGRGGELWRSRFQSCAVDGDILRDVVKYVECQPVFDKLTRKAEKYAWSSAAAHVTGKDKQGILDVDVWPGKRLGASWSKFLAKALDSDVQETFRIHAQTGRPLGSDSWVAKLEKKFRRRLHALPVGRPPMDR